MVNAMNAPRAIPELGARNDGAATEASPALQDVRQEAARLVERHKRRMQEGTQGVPLSASPVLPTTATAPALAGAIHADPQPPPLRREAAPAAPTFEAAESTLPAFSRHPDTPVGAVIKPTVPHKDHAILRPGVPRVEPVAQPAQTAVAIARSAAVAQREGARDHAEAPTLPVAPEATVEALPQQAPADRLHRPAGLPSQAPATPAQPAAPAMPPQGGAARQDGAAIVAPRATGTTVFDVPLPRLGTHQSTQVSLQPGSGQVVLTPSSERVADVLVEAARHTAWVQIDDGREERHAPRREQHSEDEDSA